MSKQQVAHVEVAGVPVGLYEKLFEEQGGVCDICKRPESALKWSLDHTYKRPRRLSIDHNHLTEEFRGLLCVSCNTRLHALENEDWLKAAKAYLKSHG